MANQVHIVPHMHWDREWYFSAEESKLLLLNNMEEILEMLENNEDYPYYVLDGQTAVLEDYLALKPKNLSRIVNLVKKGKLIIGPWYTQTDEMVVGGESIVRNLLYGHKDTSDFWRTYEYWLFTRFIWSVRPNANDFKRFWNYKKHILAGNE